MHRWGNHRCQVDFSHGFDSTRSARTRGVSCRLHLVYFSSPCWCKVRLRHVRGYRCGSIHLLYKIRQNDVIMVWCAPVAAISPSHSSYTGVTASIFIGQHIRQHWIVPEDVGSFTCRAQDRMNFFPPFFPSLAFSTVGRGAGADDAALVTVYDDDGGLHQADDYRFLPHAEHHPNSSFFRPLTPPSCSSLCVLSAVRRQFDVDFYVPTEFWITRYLSNAKSLSRTSFCVCVYYRRKKESLLPFSNCICINIKHSVTLHRRNITRGKKTVWEETRRSVIYWFPYSFNQFLL